MTTFHQAHSLCWFDFLYEPLLVVNIILLQDHALLIVVLGL